MSPMEMILDGHFILLQQLCSTFVVVEQRRWLRHVFVLVQRKMAYRWRPIAMRSFMLTHHDERFFGIAFLLQPLQCQIGNNVRAVAFTPFPLTIHLNEVRVVIIALPRKYLPVIEACWIGRQVPLADNCRLITDVLHQFWKCRLRPIKPVSVPQKAINVTVFAGQDARP